VALAALLLRHFTAALPTRRVRALRVSRDHSKDGAHSLANVERRDGGMSRLAGKHWQAGKLQCRHEP
jgi:hypothetical protein